MYCEQITSCRRFFLASIGCLGPVASAAQGPGWVFDAKALAASSTVKIGEGTFVRGRAWGDLWAAAWREGPIAARRLARGEVRASRGAFRLGLLAAVGLAGGRTAREHLEKRLATGQAADELVFASFAASSPRVRGLTRALGDVAGDRNRPEVARLGARLALLAGEDDLSWESFAATLRERDRRLVPLMTALYAAWRVSEPVPESLGSLSPESPAPDSLAELTDRALLLVAAARTDHLEIERLRALLGAAKSAKLRTIASLALARRAGARLALDLETPGLDLPAYLAGLARGGAEVDARLFGSSGGARPARWRRRFFAAGGRLVSADRAVAFVESVSRAGPDAVPAYESLCRRVLHGTLAPPLAASLRAFLESEERRADPFAAVLAVLASPRAKRGDATAEKLRASLGPARAYAFTLFEAGRLGEAGARQGPALWDRLHDQDWIVERAGPGSFERVFLDALNDIVRDLFVAGSSWDRKRRALGRARDGGPFLAEGVHEGQDAFFELVDALLASFPLFRGRRSGR